MSVKEIKELAVEIGYLEGYEYWIAPCPTSSGFNGYLVFPKRPVRERGYDGILTYVPVHGGITLAKPLEGAMVYGFDTAHSDSDKYPISDKNWIKEQLQIMLKGILKAKEVEEKYLRALTNKTKAKYAQEVIDTGHDKSYSNFGIDIRILTREL